ncbi:MAG: Gfo/Idh/MocA family oxidoreductase [Phycisphaerae bacterium]|nr:Gfo/Idh/MocA family oxidoreductase [Phycisphaerae bacterium]
MAACRLAMVGSRGHYGIVLRELPDLPEVELVGVCAGGDTAAPLLDWCSRNGRAPAQFPEYSGLLTDCRPDVVVICGPFEQHAKMAVAAIERGIHVYIEKPAALTFPELQALREACAARPGTRLVAMMQYRYAPGFFTAWKLIRSGAVGDVRLINTRKSYRLGNRPAYYHDRATYGGTIPWVGSHAIDWIAWLCPVRFESVSALHSTACNGGNGSMERAAACQFMLEGERIATVSIDIFRPESAPSHGDDWLRVVGTEGVLEARSHELRLINGSTDGSQAFPLETPPRPFADFLRYTRNEGTPLIDTQATLDVTEACLLARQAADEGRTLRFGQQDFLRKPSARPENFGVAVDGCCREDRC